MENSSARGVAVCDWNQHQHGVVICPYTHLLEEGEVRGDARDEDEVKEPKIANYNFVLARDWKSAEVDQWPAAAEVGRISWLRRVRLENPMGRGNCFSGLKLSGERDGGLG